MYAPRQPNARPALEADPGRISYSTLTDDIGISSTATSPAVLPPGRPSGAQGKDVPVADKASATAGS